VKKRIVQPTELPTDLTVILDGSPRFDRVDVEEVKGQERVTDIDAKGRSALYSKGVYGKAECLEHLGMPAAGAEEKRLRFDAHALFRCSFPGIVQLGCSSFLEPTAASRSVVERRNPRS
jgi:hypothetical protein